MLDIDAEQLIQTLKETAPEISREAVDQLIGSTVRRIAKQEWSTVVTVGLLYGMSQEVGRRIASAAVHMPLWRRT